MTVTPPIDPTKQPTAEWDMVTLKWLGRTLTGTPSTGVLSIQANRTQPFLYDDPTAPVTILPNEITAPLAAISLVDGGESREYMYVAVNIPASDDPDITGSGFTYTASIKFGNGMAYGPFTFTVPWDIPGGVLWLNKVVGTTPTPGELLPQITIAEFNNVVSRIETLEAGGGGGGTNDPNAVKLTGNQTIAGVKTFTSAPVVPDGSLTVGKTTGLQGALDGKAPTSSPTFTGTVGGITKTHVGLPNVDNTADSAKTFTTAQTTTGTFATGRLGTGTADAARVLYGDGTWKIAPSGGGTGDDPTAVKLTGAQTIDGVKTFTSSPVVPDSAFTQAKITGLSTSLNTLAPKASPTFTGTVAGITKAMVGLGNVDNVADASQTIAATQITAGTIANARLGTGTPAAGQYVDGGTGAWTALPAGGAPSYATALPGTTLTIDKTGATWPARPTDRTDIIIRWRGLTPPPALITTGTAGMYASDEYVEEIA